MFDAEGHEMKVIQLMTTFTWKTDLSRDIHRLHYCSKVWVFKEINTFIHQECLKLIKSDSKDSNKIFLFIYLFEKSEK